MYAVSFSTDNSLLASGDANGTVKLWDVSTGKLIRSDKCLPPKDWGGVGAMGIAFLPESTTVVIITEEGSWHLWDKERGFVRLRKRDDPVTGVSFAPGGRFYVVHHTHTDILENDHGMVTVFDSFSGEQKARLSSDVGRVFCTAISADGKVVAVGAHYGRGTVMTKLWEIK